MISFWEAFFAEYKLAASRPCASDTLMRRLYPPLLTMPTSDLQNTGDIAVMLQWIKKPKANQAAIDASRALDAVWELNE